MQLQSVGPAAYRERGSSCRARVQLVNYRSDAELESAGPAAEREFNYRARECGSSYSYTESVVPSAESVGPAARRI